MGLVKLMGMLWSRQSIMILYFKSNASEIVKLSTINVVSYSTLMMKTGLRQVANMKIQTFSEREALLLTLGTLIGPHRILRQGLQVITIDWSEEVKITFSRPRKMDTSL